MWEQRLRNANKLDSRILQREDIPKEIGVYAWYLRTTDELVYIGRAIGKGGLRTRIWQQHLNPMYFENRKEVFNDRDSFQLSNPVLNKGKIVICKSTFRRTLAYHHSLRAGTDCVAYMKEHFLLSFLSFGTADIQLVKDIEEELINKIQPKYNLMRST